MPTRALQALEAQSKCSNPKRFSAETSPTRRRCTCSGRNPAPPAKLYNLICAAPFFNILHASSSFLRTLSPYPIEARNFFSCALGRLFCTLLAWWTRSLAGWLLGARYNTLRYAGDFGKTGTVTGIASVCCTVSRVLQEEGLEVAVRQRRAGARTAIPTSPPPPLSNLDLQEIGTDTATAHDDKSAGQNCGYARCQCGLAPAG